jgi:peptidyl-tRNA hydrolase
MLKLYCVFDAEAVKAMKGNRGKLAAQAGHAFLHAFWDAAKRFPTSADDYQNRVDTRAYKISLLAENADVLRQLEEIYKPICGVSLVTDAGLTVFDGPTVTCLGIGPIDPEHREKILQSLPTLV